MPRRSTLLPIPRRYDAAGIRRYGFHGLSYTYLMQELARLREPCAARGRVILAHLGSGASLAGPFATGTGIDTTMFHAHGRTDDGHAIRAPGPLGL